jgi:hypothetical protein
MSTTSNRLFGLLLTSTVVLELLLGVLSLGGQIYIGIAPPSWTVDWLGGYVVTASSWAICCS